MSLDELRRRIEAERAQNLEYSARLKKTMHEAAPEPWRSMGRADALRWVLEEIAILEAQ